MIYYLLVREGTSQSTLMKIVDFINFYEDHRRRDFTFNAMSMDFDGNVYDYFNGLEDLKNNKVVFVGSAEKRIQEDYLRILRYFRFMGRMDNPQASVSTLATISTLVGGMDQISGERIWAEMRQILSSSNTLFVLDLMKSSKVLDAIGIVIDDRVIPAAKDPVTNLAGLINNQSVKTVIDRWKLSKADQIALQWLVKFRDTMLNIDQLKALVANGTEKAFVMELMKIQMRKDDFQTIKEWVPKVFPVTGQDLIDAGYSQGPEIGMALKKMKSNWVASKFTLSKDDLMD